MITFVLATLVGIFLAILASQRHRVHELENSDYRKDERIFGLVTYGIYRGKIGAEGGI
jgi:hypothetical protein